MFIFSPEDLIKLLLAVLIGGIIGMERELHSKAAGLRTITLITIGATLFTLISMKIGDDRVAANIVSGVGFLGAGVILFAEGRLKGLTTASSIWVAAAIGMAIGVGQYVLAAAVALAVIVVLNIFAGLDRWLDIKGRESRIYEVTYPLREGKFEALDKLFRECHLRVRTRKQFKQGGMMTSLWEAEGRMGDHARLVEKLMGDEEVKELMY